MNKIRQYLNHSDKYATIVNMTANYVLEVNWKTEDKPNIIILIIC